MAKRNAFLLLIASTTASAAGAQTADPSIDQISNSSSGIGFGTNTPAEPRSAAAPAQLATGMESRPATTQVTPERRSAPAPEQLSRGGKTAQPPQPLSKPADGRQSTVERVDGADRCDPADPKRSRARCATVIENRSSEFTRSNPNELSPEQRLLLEQEIREGALDTQRAARRLATTGRTDASLEAMGVAATALRPKDEVPQQTKFEEDAAKAAEIVGAIIGAPLTPPQ